MSEAAAEETGREIWIEKYRPQSLEDVVGHEAVTDRLQRYINQQDLPHLLFAGPAGTGKCVTGETPVLTNRGVERIESVVGDGDGFADPDDGLEVATFDEGDGFGFVEPSKVFGKRADELVRVSTRDGDEPTVTPEHRLLVVDGDGLSWTRAEQLRPGDRIARPLEAPLPEGDGRIEWLDELDGDRVFVHVTEEFAARHGIPASQNNVGTKREVLEGVRTGRTDEQIADGTGTPEKTVRDYRRRAADTDLDAVSTVCSLSYLRSLDASKETLREHVERVQYVSPNNSRSRPVEPPQELTTELATLLGLALSEARIDRSRIKFYNTDETLLEAFSEAARATFGVEPKRGEQKDVPYRVIDNRTVVHYLRRCFAVLDGETAGTRLVRAPAEPRRAFLQAVSDAEGHVTEDGILELTQKDESVVTLLSYLLAGEGVPTRRKIERKAATNGTGERREYHTLYVSGASALSRFEERIGFRLPTKADRLAENAARDASPNHDTIPVQSAVSELCETLYLQKDDLLTGTLNPETPGRENYLADVERVLDAATEKLELAQEALETVRRLEADIDRIEALPAAWADGRDRLEPISVRRDLSEETGIRSDRLLEYADGRRTPERQRATTLLGKLDALERPPDVEELQMRLQTTIERLEVPYNHVAEGTDLRGTDIINLLENGDHSLPTTTRFRTVAERVREVAAGMCSQAVLENLRTIDTLTRGDLYFDEVRSVEVVEESRRVYDLTVPGTRNYVAGNVPTVMHNTTSAVAIAREIYGEEWQEHFLELNASDQRGIDVVRDRIKGFARSSFGGYDHRIIFLDEADALCVPPGTEVVTGYPSSPEVKRIEDVAEDSEPIPSVDSETNEIQSDRGKLVDSGVADFFELELTDGRTVLASLTHPFFVVGSDGRLVEKELRELSPGDEIADFKDDVGVSRCEICGNWTPGRFCSVACKNDGHSREMQGDGNPMYGTEWSEERREKIVEKLSDGRFAGENDSNYRGTDERDPALVSDGGPQTVRTVEVRDVEYSHRGKAYNISMEGTPNFMLANGILTHNTSDAQSALRRTMEQFSDNARFVLSCNYSSQIIDPIQSRCAVFRFSPLGDEAVAAQTRAIAEAEGIELTDDGLDALVYAADGDMRKAINGLQAAAVMDESVDEEAVYTITSTARPEEIQEMVEQALNGDFTGARAQLDTLLTDVGIAGGDIIDQLHRSVWEFDLSEREAVRLMERVGEADYRITAGANEQVQLEALLASLALEE